jgi:hypothetical protein
MAVPLKIHMLCKKKNWRFKNAITTAILYENTVQTYFLIWILCLTWSSGQSSWLQIQRSGVDSRLYQIFWVVVGLEWGSLSLVSTTEELLERKSSGSGLESQDYGHRDPSCWPCRSLYSQTLALTLPTSGGRSVGIVCLWTQATELFFCLKMLGACMLNDNAVRVT